MKPSRFSRDYYKIMRRRRINITLIILLIISIFYFFGDNILNYMHINIKIPKISFNLPDKKKNVVEEKKQDIKDSNNQSNQTQHQKTEYKSINYTKADGATIDILIDTSTNKIAQLNDVTSKTNYAVDKNKNFVVFDDILAGKILMCDTKGNISEISKDYYRSKSLSKNIYRKDILKYKPTYIWAAKPYITDDNRVIYISQLPYFKNDAEFYLWAYDLKTKETRRIGALGTNKIESIDYIGYHGKTLNIKSKDAIYKLDSSSYKLYK